MSTFYMYILWRPLSLWHKRWRGAVGCTYDSKCGGRGFKLHQRPPLFPWARNVTLIAYWFQERIRAWYHNRTKI